MSKAPKLVPPPIHLLPIRELYLATEAPKGINLVVRDSSRGSPLTDAELEASIYASGIIHPLIYKVVDDKRYVIAGNRRLKMLRKIFADAMASPVQTQDVADFGGDWREVAIDTNLSLPSHLVERYEIIVGIAKDLKLQPADVQARFGMTPRQYLQVMALGKMSETVRAAWKAAEIDAPTAQAFTLEPDPKEQDRIFALAKKNAWQGQIREHDVSSRIVPSSQREMGKMVAFVGLDVVKSAKLLKVEDLFPTDRGARHTVTDIKALNKLVGDKLAAKCKELTDSGWSWAIPESEIQGSTWHYGSVGEKKNYTDAEKKKSGCFVKILDGGEFHIEYGKITPAERKSVVSSSRSQKVAAKKKAKVKAGEVGLTNALAERLSVQLEKALKASISATPDVAVAALIAAFASNGHILDVAVNGESRNSYGKQSSSKNFLQVFDGAIKSTAEARVVMLAEVVSAAISVQIHHADTKAPIADEALQALVAKMNGGTLSKCIASEFDAKDYFAGVNLQACVDAVRAACGQGAADEVAKMKKGDAAKFAASHVVKEGWLPKELRTVHYKGPTEKGSPAKRAAKAKAAPKKAAKKAKSKK